MMVIYIYVTKQPAHICNFEYAVLLCGFSTCTNLGLDVTYEAFSLRTPPWALEKSMSQNIHDQSVPEPCDNPKVVVHPGTILLGFPLGRRTNLVVFHSTGQ
uniref:uncharacterized protein LOC117611118 isoform X2 n=1 Tax=Osmia lignaria TaxID=473952 RepID=UPI001478DBD7|nr:uncharacterized protein LOC117611118 isoform X2 [Osmia lignaria]XP_034194924.1 uncharacterized protein LOC117611118 isoform X2 [Osmia lignaria]XP_034194925.1 uncharacterized protein LOC117611118 isoform X2 [Osmia lignaria]XP_034195216.1 uncharacterized protein LOC117611394 isoform X2 [Osmia lignaria]XP_034195218.1 uncharacterized protein LOC117611394 isoform X2 [Osmia lignaria]XP_034195219.1 uncharacterized protein LOC117611394 isoform X2 [Osmia lignaria]